MEYQQNNAVFETIIEIPIGKSLSEMTTKIDDTGTNAKETNIQMQQQIIENLQTLHSFQLKEVLNFVIFLQQKQTKSLPNRSEIAALRGKYKNNLSSSEVFAKQKLEEIKKEEAKW